ncbi:STAS domain-containing protein [Kutzneria chonburiensis]|uniref:Anti-sigma factor antagonist n=1 Tax=Kutzneria chonburiensis TaxID=1483604 RepID=A0ABV6MUS1_9PSEU|nr:STAS domain-containing protein [Kutzneria chonburiensis]
MPENSGSFAAATELVGGVAVVRLAGELDMQTVPAATLELDNAIEGAPAGLVVDLTGLTFLASAGLAMLAAVSAKAGQASVTLRLAADNRVVLRPLQITGLDAGFDIRESVESALGDLG